MLKNRNKGRSDGKNNPVRSSFFYKKSKKPQKMAVLFMKREFNYVKAVNFD